MRTNSDPWGPYLRALEEHGDVPASFRSLLGADCQDLNVFEAVLRAGADVNEGGGDPRSPYRQPPLHLACFGHRPEVVQWLLANGADVHWANDRGETSLHLVCKLRSSLAMVQGLVAAGAREDVRDQTGRTPRDWVVHRLGRSHDSSEVARRQEVLDWLDSRGCGLR